MNETTTEKGFTRQEIIDYVIHHEDGFTYAQLQTGITKQDLEQLLEEEGLKYCEFCWQYKYGVFFETPYLMYCCPDCDKLDVEDKETMVW